MKYETQQQQGSCWVSFHATEPTDPDVPILRTAAEIQSIDRLKTPYNPEQPTYLEQGISLDTLLRRLDE